RRHTGRIGRCASPSCERPSPPSWPCRPPPCAAPTGRARRPGSPPWSGNWGAPASRSARGPCGPSTGRAGPPPPPGRPPQARPARGGPDPEVRRGAAERVARIEQRLENERVLRPRRVRLVYKGTPLAEAVADFARQTGFPIRLHGDQARFAGRRVTLDTGDT